MPDDLLVVDGYLFVVRREPTALMLGGQWVLLTALPTFVVSNKLPGLLQVRLHNMMHRMAHREVILAHGSGRIEDSALSEVQ